MRLGLMLLFQCFFYMSFAQFEKTNNFWVGAEADYAYSGSSNTIVLGPAFFWRKENGIESEFWQIFTLAGGFSWSYEFKSSLVASLSYNVGYVPGISIGISTQQYYKVFTKNEYFATDVRLSGEITFAFFGFLSYRYQHPAISRNEAVGISRHAFVFKIPIPMKAVR
ncbi:hypothetical protein [Carboxylicivirga sp. N1Y90]|uniref:hypothetical protein n=1 Tax=Carboxylicivirga fragile TaxID=3417571 RepID=UPI003D333B40|nr:hypothetical protein [Marinilabiliaceae bacterium N1Y90]